MTPPDPVVRCIYAAGLQSKPKGWTILFDSTGPLKEQPIFTSFPHALSDNQPRIVRHVLPGVVAPDARGDDVVHRVPFVVVDAIQGHPEGCFSTVLTTILDGIPDEVTGQVVGSSMSFIRPTRITIDEFVCVFTRTTLPGSFKLMFGIPFCRPLGMFLSPHT